MSDSHNWERSEKGFERLRDLILTGTWPVIRAEVLNAMATMDPESDHGTAYVLSFSGPDAIHDDRPQELAHAILDREQALILVQQLQNAIAAEDHFRATGERTVNTKGGLVHGG